MLLHRPHPRKELPMRKFQNWLNRKLDDRKATSYQRERDQLWDKTRGAQR
jgi:hypothetical protein